MLYQDTAEANFHILWISKNILDYLFIVFRYIKCPADSLTKSVLEFLKQGKERFLLFSNMFLFRIPDYMYILSTRVGLWELETQLSIQAFQSKSQSLRLRFLWGRHTILPFWIQCRPLFGLFSLYVEGARALILTRNSETKSKFEQKDGEICAWSIRRSWSNC